MNLQLFNRKQKVLLFGGSFDPIHNGHIKVLETAIKQIKPNKIFIIPSFISPGKIISNIVNEDKIEMIKMAIKHIPNVEIIDYELLRKQMTYFIETLRYLKMSEKENSNYFLLIGQDQLHNLETWKEYEEVIKNVHKIIVYNRNHQIKNSKECGLLIKKYKNIKFLRKCNLIDISSTRIREEYVLENDLNPDVLEYINSNGLYGLNRIQKYCSEQRVSHSLSVAYYAKELMAVYNDKLSKKAFVAGIYHDIAKNLEKEEQIEIAKKLGISEYPSWKVLHPYIGSYFLSSKFLFKDEEILNAISRHTLPFLNYENEPTLLDKVIYVADKLEPNRTNDDIFGNKPINYFRDLAKIDINKCFNELYENLQQWQK